MPYLLALVRSVARLGFYVYAQHTANVRMCIILVLHIFPSKSLTDNISKFLMFLSSRSILSRMFVFFADENNNEK